MKKIFLTLAVMVSAVSFAQQKTEYDKNVEKLVALAQAPMKKVMLSQFEKLVPTHKLPEFAKEVEATFPELLKNIEKTYKEIYTEQEVKDILKFYESPAGQKMLEKMPEITEKSMKAGQDWAMKLQPILMKYVQ